MKYKTIYSNRHWYVINVATNKTVKTFDGFFNDTKAKRAAEEWAAELNKRLAKGR